MFTVALPGLTVKLESSRLLSVTRLEISFDVCQYYVHMSTVHVATSINSTDRKSENRSWTYNQDICI